MAAAAAATAQCAHHGKRSDDSITSLYRRASWRSSRQRGERDVQRQHPANDRRPRVRRGRRSTAPSCAGAYGYVTRLGARPSRQRWPRAPPNTYSACSSLSGGRPRSDLGHAMLASLGPDDLAER